MKKFISFFVLALGVNILSAEDLNIAKIIPQGMLIDPKTPARYSIMNILDNKPSTVYAMENSKINKSESFIKFFLADDTSIDTIKIKNGYFEEKYFKLNNRLAKIRIVKKYEGKTLSTQTFNLDDSMTEQTLILNDKNVCREICIDLVEIYKGEKWDDTVVSDISFYNSAKQLNAQIVSKGKMLSLLYIHSFEYDENGISKESNEYGKAGGDDCCYLRNNYNGRAEVALLYDMDEDFYINYYYEGNDSLNPFQKVTYSQKGNITEKINYTYENGKLATEKCFGNYPYKTIYTYNGNNLIKEEHSYENNSERNNTVEYFYQNNKIISQTVSKSGNIETVTQYFYKNNLLDKKIPIYSNQPTGYGNDGYNSLPDIYFYEYKDNKLIKEFTVDSFKTF